jgi:hypothetical protein
MKPWWIDLLLLIWKHSPSWLISVDTSSISYEVGMRVFDTGSYPKGIFATDTPNPSLKHKPAHSSCQRFTNPTKSIADYNIPPFSLAFLTRSIIWMHEMQVYTEFMHCEVCSNRREGTIEPLAFRHADVPLSRNRVFKRECCGTHDRIWLSQIRDSPNLEGQVPIFISPGTGWPKMEVLDPASTRKEWLTRSKSESNLCYDRRSVGQSVLE